jgi:recombinational DNA repair protein RecT
MSLEITPDGADPLAKLAALTAVEACGHLADPRNAPPAVIGYAKGFARAVVAIAKTVKSLRASDPAVVHNALSRIAREGLTPGDVGDKTSTAYLSPGKGGQISSEPNPRGRLAMARAAGVEVRTVAIHKGDKIALNGDGDVDTDSTTLDPDNRPTKWEHVKGVMIHLDDVHTGARRSAWVSAAEIAERKAKADGQGAWNTDPISMACSKAIKIAISRGAIPQASLIPAILAASAAHPTPARALTIEAAAAPRQIAEPTPVAPSPAEPEPTPEPEPQPEAPAEPEQPVTSATGAGDVFDAIVVDLAAEAECTQETAATTVVRALEALKKTGRPFAIEDLRSQTMWARLVQRAGEAERAARDEA